MENKQMIVVAQRGWVLQGQVSREGTEITIENAKVIRRWGTQNGLGELALEGPKESTILDPAGTVRIHELAIVLKMDCKTEWP